MWLTEIENAVFSEDQRSSRTLPHNMFEIQEHIHCSCKVQLIILGCQFQTMVCKVLKALYAYRPFRRQNVEKTVVMP